MSDNELLLAISNMMDKKLEPVNDRLQKIELTQENNILPRLDKIEQSQRETEQSLREMEQSQREMEQSLRKVEQTQKKMELTQENIILPRLQNIEACYTSTFKRYQTGVEQIESMQDDIDIIKKVVIEHSEKLQRLA